MTPFRFSLVLLFALQLTAFGALPASGTFEVVGQWQGSQLPGHRPDLGTYYASTPDASATWRPALQSVCPVRVSFWIAPHPSNAATAKIEAQLASGLLTIPLDLTAGEARWQELTDRKLDFAGERAGRGLRGGRTVKSTSRLSSSSPDRRLRARAREIRRRQLVCRRPSPCRPPAPCGHRDASLIRTESARTLSNVPFWRGAGPAMFSSRPQPL